MHTPLNRRDFLKAAGGTAALAAASPVLAARKGMFLTMRNLNGFWVEQAPAWNVEWQAMARLAASTGYAGVDLPFGAIMKDGPEKVRALLAELKLRPGFLSTGVNPFIRDEAAFQTAFKGFDNICKFAAAIECPRLMFRMNSSMDVPKDEWRKISLGRARAMSQVMDRHNVRVGIEFSGPLHYRKQFPYEFIYRVPETTEFCKDAGPNWGLALDSWHWHHAGGTVEDIIAAGKSRIVAVHICDAKQQRPEDVKDLERVMPGEGVVNLDGFLKALRKIGYEGGVSPEPLRRFAVGTSAEEVARASLASSVAVMKKAGIKLA